MTFDWLKLRHSGPTRDAGGQHRPQRPPQVITRPHGKRPGFVPPAVAQARRGHHRDQHQSSSAPAPRAPPPVRKGPVVRSPARPHPSQRGHSKLLQCLHIHFHPSHKRDRAPPSSRPVKPPLKAPMKAPVKPSKPTKHLSSHQVPPFPPPRGAMKPPPRRVHWAPAQAPLPYQPYPYPSHTSSSTPSHATSHAPPHARPQQYVVPLPVPRYQPPPRQSRGVPHQPHKRK